MGFNNHTLRMYPRISIGGDTLRVRVSNAYGNGKLEIGAACVEAFTREGARVGAVDRLAAAAPPDGVAVAADLSREDEIARAFCDVERALGPLDVLVQSRRNAKAAKRFFKKLLKGLRYVPRVIVTDKLRSYGAAKRKILPGVEHRQSRYLNNRAEVSHQPTRRRERHMQRFKSACHGVG